MTDIDLSNFVDQDVCVEQRSKRPNELDQARDADARPDKNS